MSSYLRGGGGGGVISLKVTTALCKNRNLMTSEATLSLSEYGVKDSSSNMHVSIQT